MVYKKFSSEIGGAFQAVTGTPLNFKDLVQTDAITTAVIAFDVGGRAIIPPSRRFVLFNEDIFHITPAYLDDLSTAKNDVDTLESLKPNMISKSKGQCIDGQRFMWTVKGFPIEIAGGTMGGLEG